MKFQTTKTYNWEEWYEGMPIYVVYDGEIDTGIKEICPCCQGTGKIKIPFTDKVQKCLGVIKSGNLYHVCKEGYIYQTIAGAKYKKCFLKSFEVSFPEKLLYGITVKGFECATIHYYPSKYRFFEREEDAITFCEKHNKMILENKND